MDEEQGSSGARAANIHPMALRCDYMINGEPTDNDLAIGSKGSLRFYIKTEGKAAHSAYPEQGESAIEKLLDILTDIRQAEFPTDEFFGETTNNIGLIDGGLKTNVIAPYAEAGLHIRLTTNEKPVLEVLEKTIGGRGRLEIMSVARPVKMLEVEGFQSKSRALYDRHSASFQLGNAAASRRGFDSRRAYERRIRFEKRFGRSGRALCKSGEEVVNHIGT